ncbi:MAG: hypothetical protein HeimC2_17580 [Candidatus Heimdallarchaeota archaeon LC_2]|nr:MAG: hypothetical protein HeimC2_17580 [Candidatus Heimdallarchaeota archaeon LC_2]
MYTKNDHIDGLLLFTSIYHQKQNNSHSFNSFTKCNGRSSINWTKYEEHNFKKGIIFNINIGTEVNIPGRRCKKCEILITD